MRALLDSSMAVDLEAVGPLLARLVAVAAERLPEDRMLCFEFAAIEALTNAVRHGGPRQAGAEIQVTLQTTATEFLLTILDPTGIPITPDMFAPPDDTGADADLLAEGGRGLGIMRNCTDRLGFERKGGANVLTLAYNLGDHI
jgi:serine/threonine-protein kinase RsbW